MAAEEQAPTSGEYIHHHLTHLSNIDTASPVDFHVVHWDSVFFSSVLGLVFLVFGLLVALAGCLTVYWVALAWRSR